MLLLKIFLVSSLMICSVASRGKSIPHRRGLRLRQRLHEIMRSRQRNTAEICYDAVGCFELSNPRSPLQKLPENPENLNTKFYLFRRNIKFSEPEIVHYDSITPLTQSKFNSSQPLKIIIHGFLGAWNNYYVLNATYSYLKIYDCNIICMEWSTAAKGPEYAQAAANTEVVGRQLGLLLYQMINIGLNPNDIHLIGFSLGAHVAACASELLKNNNYLIGRITGLDAASPLFRNKNVREKSKKLDKSDAKFVDVLHTDASPVFVDGFGLWEPIGHVDFFANGGKQQPGCIDRQLSVVLTHLERGFTKNSTCSHARAFELFLESLMHKTEDKNSCQFIAFKCVGGMSSFERGQCFPTLDNLNNPLAINVGYRSDIGIIGEDARGSGVMYFATRDAQPYCGTQLQAQIQVSQKTPQAVGILVMELRYDNEAVKFQIYCNLLDLVARNTDISSLSAVKYNSLHADLKKMQMTISFYHYELQKGNNDTHIIPDEIIIEAISVRDMFGNSWTYYGQTVNINGEKEKQKPYGVIIVLRKTK